MAFLNLIQISISPGDAKSRRHDSPFGRSRFHRSDHVAAAPPAYAEGEALIVQHMRSDGVVQQAAEKGHGIPR